MFAEMLWAQAINILCLLKCRLCAQAIKILCLLKCRLWAQAINKLLDGIPMESPLRDVLSGGSASTKSDAAVQLKAATSDSVLLAVQYRMYQKLICWDFVLQLLGDLQTAQE
jgi:hypothetical protein